MTTNNIESMSLNWHFGSFLYGTEFKKSPEMVTRAIVAGFRAIDTAAQPRNCSEEAVGAGIQQALVELNGEISRADLWIQTKFTPLGAQYSGDVLPDDVPYKPDDILEVMIDKSIQSSMEKLKVDYLDAFLLHEPLDTMEDTLRAWKHLQTFVPTTIRHLGISNADVHVVRALCSNVEILPSVVQSRFRLVQSQHVDCYDFELRAACKELKIAYQPFWVLKANPHLLRTDLVSSLASHFKVTSEQVLYALVASLDGSIHILNGTTDPAHMIEDLRAMRIIGNVPESVARNFEQILKDFSAALNISK